MESNFTFRVDGELKKAFEDAARANHRSGSQLLRDFMRHYIRAHEVDPEQDLSGELKMPVVTIKRKQAA